MTVNIELRSEIQGVIIDAGFVHEDLSVAWREAGNGNTELAIENLRKALTYADQLRSAITCLIKEHEDVQSNTN